MKSTNKKGIALIPIIVGMILSLLLIGILLRLFLAHSNELAKQERLVATQMSDYGFQYVTERISSIEDLAQEDFKSVDSTVLGNGWYKIKVQKDIKYDTMYITIESIGGAGDEIVCQNKLFKLFKTVCETGECWSALSH